MGCVLTAIGFRQVVITVGFVVGCGLGVARVTGGSNVFARIPDDVEVGED